MKQSFSVKSTSLSASRSPSELRLLQVGNNILGLTYVRGAALTVMRQTAPNCTIQLLLPAPGRGHQTDPSGILILGLDKSAPCLHADQWKEFPERLRSTLHTSFPEEIRSAIGGVNDPTVPTEEDLDTYTMHLCVSKALA